MSCILLVELSVGPVDSCQLAPNHSRLVHWCVARSPGRCGSLRVAHVRVHCKSGRVVDLCTAWDPWGRILRCLRRSWVGGVEGVEGVGGVDGAEGVDFAQVLAVAGCDPLKGSRNAACRSALFDRTGYRGVASKSQQHSCSSANNLSSFQLRAITAVSYKLIPQGYPNFTMVSQFRSQEH